MEFPTRGIKRIYTGGALYIEVALGHGEIKFIAVTLPEFDFYPVCHRAVSQRQRTAIATKLDGPVHN